MPANSRLLFALKSGGNIVHLLGGEISPAGKPMSDDDRELSGGCTRACSRHRSQDGRVLPSSQSGRREIAAERQRHLYGNAASADKGEHTHTGQPKCGSKMEAIAVPSPSPFAWPRRRYIVKLPHGPSHLALVSPATRVSEDARDYIRSAVTHELGPERGLLRLAVTPASPPPCFSLTAPIADKWWPASLILGAITTTGLVVFGSQRP
ncbi:hypothetical protein BaRGS_00016929 [Batillaria attramentaria]|uniref:Uncharacterized protein n=1 Tax=Batillaria attramentaria TaxID=370345 RepID=A0ABD0KXV7_9CAEN